MNAPCKDCPDRHIACHDHCQKYQEWKKAFREAKERSAREHYSPYSPPDTIAARRAMDKGLKDQLRHRKKYY